MTTDAEAPLDRFKHDVRAADIGIGDGGARDDLAAKGIDDECAMDDVVAPTVNSKPSAK